MKSYICTLHESEYTNITSKHHDGFCLFKNAYAPFWNSVDVGPHRDICAELKRACDRTDVKFGVYHSVYEWWHPTICARVSCTPSR